MSRKKSRRYKQRCLRCGFEWHSYKKNPARCANLKGKCCSKYWNKPKESEEAPKAPIPLPVRTPEDDLGPFEWIDKLNPKKKPPEPIDLRGLKF